MNKKLMLGLCAALVVLAACAPATPSSSSIGTAIAQTRVALPTQTLTAAPSATATPSPVPSATATQIPPTATTTDTPKPTDTLMPTSTLAPPTVTPTPIAFKGTGDSVIDLPGKCVCVAHITGNAGSRFFAVETLDANGKTVDLLVNTTDPYDGYKPVDFLDGQQSTRIKVTGGGGWTNKLVDLSNYDRHVIVPGHFEGKGDDLIALAGGKKPDLLNITGNPHARFFAVETWSSRSHELLVNTTDPYSGTVPIASDAVLIQVTANDTWSIDVTTK